METAPPVSNSRRLPTPGIVRPFFLKPLTSQKAYKVRAERKNFYYIADRLNSAAMSVPWISSQFGKPLEEIDRSASYDSDAYIHQRTGDFYAAGKVSGHIHAGIGISCGSHL